MSKRPHLPRHQDVLRTDEECEEPGPGQTPFPPDDSVPGPGQTPSAPDDSVPVPEPGPGQTPFPPDECEEPGPEPTPTPTEEPEPPPPTIEEVATSVNAEVLGLIDQCTQALAVTESQDMTNASKCLSNASEWLVRASAPSTPATAAEATEET